MVASLCKLRKMGARDSLGVACIVRRCNRRVTTHWVGNTWDMNVLPSIMFNRRQLYMYVSYFLAARVLIKSNQKEYMVIPHTLFFSISKRIHMSIVIM
jgi:hypothetical protein